MEIKKISDSVWEIPKEGSMLVPGKVYASEKLIKQILEEEMTLKQISNVAKLPGIIKASHAMPDCHMGYGMPIGGVAAFDLEKGVISPGAIGFDINCGVRLLATDITLENFMKKREEVLHDLTRTIPSGVGRGGKVSIGFKQLDEVMKKGVQWAIENKYGIEEDKEFCEEQGQMEGANPETVSERAKKRGIGQLGTLGAGNHFVDVQVVDKIFNKEVAKVFGIEKGKIVFMIHCGSRGLGHQIASDYVKACENEYGIKNLPDRELAHAPIKSKLGQDYLSAMKCAVNFAFCNRQIIMDKIRNLLKRYFPENNSKLIYDVAHNIAKFEPLELGKEEKIMVIRKGATRAFGPERENLPKDYKKVGQPVLIPGSMSTHSFVLVGKRGNEKISFSSSAHGAGRAHSRLWAHRTLTHEKVKKILEEKDIILKGSNKGTLEESELSYKDVEEVIDATEKAGLSERVASLKPIAVMIG